MEYQLRAYDVEPGRMDEFLGLFPDIVEIRRELGFEVVGVWQNHDTNRFVWIVGYDGQGSFEEATQRYYDSPGRAELDPNPADLLTGVHTEMLVAVPVA